MSNLKFNLSTDIEALNKVLKQWPQETVKTLSGIARRGRILLRKDLLSGQALNLKSSTKDKIGRHLISGIVGRRFSIIFASYPVNLYERGRTLRSGKREAGKYIITKQFKTLFGSKLNMIANEEMKKTVNRMVARI